MRDRIGGILLSICSLVGLAGPVLAYLLCLWPVNFIVSPDGRCVGRFYILPGTQTFLCNLSDRETGQSTEFRVGEYDMYPEAFAWSPAGPPKLAVQRGGATILIFSLKAGGWERKEISGSDGDTIRQVTWTPRGDGLVFSVRLEHGLRGLRFWREGMTEPVPVAVTGKAMEFAFCLLFEDEVLASTRGPDGKRHIWRVDLAEPAVPLEVADDLPEGFSVLTLQACPSDPGLLLIGSTGVRQCLARLESMGSPPRTSSLARLGPVFSGRAGFSSDGKVILQTTGLPREKNEKLVERNPADGSCTVLSQVPFQGYLSVFIVHPEKRWLGLASYERTGLPPLASGTRRILRDASGAGNVRLAYEIGNDFSWSYDWFYNPWRGEPGHYVLFDVRLGTLFPEAFFFDPLTGAVTALPDVLNWGVLGTAGFGMMGFLLMAFLVNTGLFAVLTFGRGGSPGAKPLGLFFWCLSWLSPLYLRGLQGTLNLDYLYGPAVTLPLLLLACLTVLALFWLPFATLRFATEFPVPNPFKVRFPRSVLAARTVTLLFPPVAALAGLYAMAQTWLHWQGADISEAGPVFKATLPLLGTIFAVLTALGFVVLILSLAAVVHNFRFAPDPRTKGQLRYVALGFLVSLGWLATGWIVAIAMESHVQVRTLSGILVVLLLWFGPVLLIPGLFCGYALLSRELMDVSFVVRRTVKYAIVLGALGLLFLGIVAGLGVLLPSVLGSRSPVSAALATAVVLLAFQPLRRRVQDWVDRRFDRARYDARRTLGELATRFSTMGSLPEIVGALEDSARDVLRVGESRVVFFGGGKVRSAPPSSAGELQPSDVSGLDVKEIASLLSVDLPWVKLAVPVAHGGKVYAALALGEKLSQEKVSPEDREFVRILTDGAGLALKNLTLVKEAARAEVLERDLAGARAIQERYFPRSLPEIPGFRLAALNRPARVVGGDYYDVSALPDGRLALVVADVSGKGMPAALRVAEVHSYLHAVLRDAADPGATLNAVNAYLRGTLERGEFVTIFLGILDPGTGRLQSACAGHPSPFLRSGTGEVTSLVHGGSLPLGIDAGEQYSTHEVVLEPGNLLAIYSDGLPEMKNREGELFGFDRLEKAFGTVDTALSADHDLAALVQAAVTFADGEPAEDDVTLLLLGVL